MIRIFESVHKGDRAYMVLDRDTLSRDRASKEGTEEWI